MPEDPSVDPRPHEGDVPGGAADRSGGAAEPGAAGNAAGAPGAGAGGSDPSRFPDDTSDPMLDSRRMPPWLLRAMIVFWLLSILAGIVRYLWVRVDGLVLLVVISLFLALAIEPGVNRLARRGWRRGRATGLILLGVIAATGIFVGAMGTLVGTQIADLLQNSEQYIRDTVDAINDTFGTELDPQEVVDEFNRPDGPVQEFIDAQQDNVVNLSLQALDGLVQAFSVLLFTYYLVADGPRMRRSICSRLRPDRQRMVLAAWELAITKTGGYLYSRALLALISALFHWAAFQASGVQAPIPLALWVGLVSQFLPVVGTYIAGVLPVLITFLDDPIKAAVVLGFIVVYQQIENYFFAPRITARTMELHPAVAFGAALGGFAMLGVAGAILALPAAAMVQALASEWGVRHEVIDDELTDISPPGPHRHRKRPA